MQDILKVILIMVVCLGLRLCKQNDCHTACSTSPLQHSMALSMSNLQNQISASLQKVTVTCITVALLLLLCLLCLSEGV